MVKFVHCADLHLGSAFSAFDPRRAAVLRKGMERSFNEMIAFCISSRADILFLCGDVFDTPSPSADTLKLFTDGIGRLESTKVFMALGNHDCGVRLPKLKNLHLFSTEPERVHLPEFGLSVWGQSFFTENPPTMEGLFQKKDGVNLLCVHGNLNSENYNSIPAALLQNSGFIYAALGHKHNHIAKVYGHCTACYSGSLVGRGFDETGEKGFVYGETDLCSVKLSFIPSTARRFETEVLDLTANEEQALLGFENSLCESSLYRVKLIGGMLSPEYVRRRLESRVFYAEAYNTLEDHSPFFELLKEELQDDPAALSMAIDALMGRRDLL